jgi:acyl-CoA dehydrogenase
VPETAHLSEEAKCFRYLSDSLKPDRILIGAEAIGLARDALWHRSQCCEVPGARASFEAVTLAVITHGGMGYAKEYQVERLFRESILTHIIPVTEQLILSFIGENVLDLPKSY